MSAITLHRIDPARNMHRFYRLDVQPDLFGAWCVVREWGQIGQGGQMRVVPYPTMTEAQAALDRQRRIKERRGYVVVGTTSPRPFPPSSEAHQPPEKEEFAD
jgi:predicted DNA-binding WGR domain protein